MRSSSTTLRGQVVATAENFAHYHKPTPPPPNTICTFLGRKRPRPLVDLDFAIAAMLRALLATHPEVALSEWRRNAATRMGRSVEVAS